MDGSSSRSSSRSTNKAERGRTERGRAATPGMAAAFERLSDHADEWGPERILCEGLDLIRDSSWADECRLYSVLSDTAVAIEVAARPGPSEPRTAVPTDWFPWGLAPANPRRFLLIADATRLPASPESARTVGDEGFASCLHLPILERQRPIGAMQLYWREPHVAWDDQRGRLMRLLGHFLLTRCTG